MINIKVVGFVDRGGVQCVAEAVLISLSRERIVDCFLVLLERLGFEVPRNRKRWILKQGAPRVRCFGSWETTED